MRIKCTTSRERRILKLSYRRIFSQGFWLILRGYAKFFFWFFFSQICNMSMNGSVLSPLQRDASCMSELKSTSKCLRMHLNSLWSIWYGIFITLLNGYIAIECSKRFFGE